MEPNDHTVPAATPADGTSDRRLGRAAHHRLAEHAPKWRTTEAELRHRLESGGFDTTFPTDRDVMAQYGVCRETARRAIGALVAEGLVRRRRGLGSAIDRPAVTRTAGVIETLEQTFADDQRFGHQLLGNIRTTNYRAAAALGLPDDQQFIELRRRYLLDQQPVAVETCWLLPSLRYTPTQRGFTHETIYTQLRAAEASVPTSGEEQISATIPTREERRLLGLQAGSAVLKIVRRGDIGAERVESREMITRPQLIQLHGSWRAGRSNTLRLALAVGDDDRAEHVAHRSIGAWPSHLVF